MSSCFVRALSSGRWWREPDVQSVVPEAEMASAAAAVGLAIRMRTTLKTRARSPFAVRLARVPAKRSERLGSRPTSAGSAPPSSTSYHAV